MIYKIHIFTILILKFYKLNIYLVNLNENEGSRREKQGFGKSKILFLEKWIFYLFIFIFLENSLNTRMNENLTGSLIPILYSNVSKHILKITICYEI